MQGREGSTAASQDLEANHEQIVGSGRLVVIGLVAGCQANRLTKDIVM